VEEAYERSRDLLLGEFARRIEAEAQLVMRNHRHEQQQQQQQHRGDSVLKKTMVPRPKLSAGGSRSGRAPTTSWSDGKR
jgi:hypothetical protein